MAERRESVRVSASGSDFDREFSAIERKAASTAAALKAIPDRVRVNADARGLSGVERDALKAQAALRGIPNEILVRGDTSGFDKIERDARRAERSTSGLVDAAFALGPALVPIGAVAVPALAGLTAQLGFAAGAAGSALLAFNGVGDGLKALNAYQLDPSTANLQKLNEAMDALGPAGQDFVRQLDRISPALKTLKVAAENGVLPGVGDALDILIRRLPEARNLLSQFSDATGDLARQGAEGLAGPKFQAFFDYLSNNARPILMDLGSAFGNLTLGFANLLAGFAPLERDFSTFLANSARDFANWSATFADSEGFQDFINYVREAAPQVGETLGKIGSALLSVVEAAAPVGGATLQILGALADVITRLADSPLGTPLIAFAAAIATVNRALAASALAKNSLVTDLLYGRLDSKTGQRGTNAIGQLREQFTGLTPAVRAANVQLAEAQAVQNRIVAQAKRNAQSGALIPRAQQVQQVKDYRVAQEGVASASRRVAEAEAKAAASRRQMLGSAAKGAAVIGALALATTGAGDKIGLTNTTSLALAGTLAGPVGAGAGAAAGAFLDVRGAAKDAEEAFRALDRATKGTDYGAIAASVDKANKSLKDANSTTQKFLRGTIASLPGGNALGKFLTPDIDEGATQRAQEKLDNLRRVYEGLARTAGTPLPANASTKQIQAFATSVRPQLEAAGISFRKLGQGSAAEFAKAQDALQAFNVVLVDANSRASQLGTTLQNALNPKVSLVQARDAVTTALRDLEKLKGAAGIAQNKTSPDAVANRALVNNALNQTTALIQKQVEAGASSDKLAQTLQRSRKSIIDQGVAAGISRGEMVQYVNSIGLTPKLIETTIRANVKEAQSQVNGYLKTLSLTPKQRATLMKLASSGATGDLKKYVSRLNLTPAQKKTLITALTAAARGNISAVQRQLDSLRNKTVTVAVNTINTTINRAIGSVFGGKKKARGGWIYGPGGPREDKIPAMLSNGEYVINARAAQKYRREIEWINAQGLANGGFAGTAPTSTSVRVAAPSLVGATISGTLRVDGNVATIEDARIVAQQEIAREADTQGRLARAGGH